MSLTESEARAFIKETVDSRLKRIAVLFGVGYVAAVVAIFIYLQGRVDTVAESFSYSLDDRISTSVENEVDDVFDNKAALIDDIDRRLENLSIEEGEVTRRVVGISSRLPALEERAAGVNLSIEALENTDEHALGRKIRIIEEVEPGSDAILELSMKIEDLQKKNDQLSTKIVTEEVVVVDDHGGERILLRFDESATFGSPSITLLDDSKIVRSVF
jgi:hypothetical protein